MTRIVLSKQKTVSASSPKLWFKRKAVDAKLRALVSSRAALEQEQQQRRAAKPTKVTSSKTSTTLVSQRARQRAQLRKLSDLQLEEEAPRPWTPRPHDKLGMRHLLHNACAGLFADPGMGKTSITLGAIKVLKQQQMTQRVLVIAPLRPCYLVWPKERHKWQDFHGLTMQVLHGPRKEQALATPADVYVINPDGLEWLIDNHLDWWLECDTLVVDESTKFKHTNTKRFKRICKILGHFARRWILTGTPTPNGYLDLFGQIFMLDLGKALGQYITHYRFNYFMPVGYGGYTWVLKEGSELAIQQQIKPYILRLSADAKSMPTLVPNVIRIELPDSVRKLYDEMEEDMLTLLEGGTEVQAKNAAAASTKCRQIANGGLYYMASGPVDSNGFRMQHREFENLHTEKVDAVGDLHEQLQGSPLMVAFDFEHDLDRLLRKFPKAEVMGSGVSMPNTLKIEAAWNAGRINMLLVQPQSVGHGLNLQTGPGHTLCWHSLTWDYEIFDQMIRRLWRTGQRSRHVFNHFIVARNTVDESVLQALRSKHRGQQALLDALRSYARQRTGKSAK